MNVPRVVIDTNILVSILKGKSPLLPLYTDFKEGRLELVISPDLIKELADVLNRPIFKIDPRNIKELFLIIKARAAMIRPSLSSLNVGRDPKDNFLLELARESKADFIITGDKDLLVLNPFEKIQIVSPKEYLSRFK